MASFRRYRDIVALAHHCEEAAPAEEEDAPAEHATQVSTPPIVGAFFMTHLDVRLLMTPVVVSYCAASAKMDAIPAEFSLSIL